MPTIAEIGTNRLMNVLVRDKNQSPARTLSILKSEITSLLECYLELDDEIKDVYTFFPTPSFVSLLIFAKEIIDPPHCFAFYSEGRTKPYLV